MLYVQADLLGYFTHSSLGHCLGLNVPRRWGNHAINIIAWLPQPLDTFNTLRPRQDGRRFANDTFKRIFLNENVRITIKIWLKFVPKGPINNIPALV